MNWKNRIRRSRQFVCNSIRAAWNKGLFHIFAGTFCTKLITFFGSIVLVRVLSKQEYGVLGYLENIYSYLFVIAGMGLSNAILRYVVLGKTNQEKYNYFAYAYKHGILWNAFLILFAWLVSLIYPHPSAYRPYTWLLNVLILAIPFQYVTDNVLCNERAQFSNQRYAYFSLALSFTVIVSKIMSGKFLGIQGVICCQVMLYIVLAFIFLHSCKHKYYCNLSAEKITSKRKREFRVYSFQYMITNGLWAVFMLNDIFLLGRFSNNPEIVADYRVAYTIPGAVSLFSSAIGIFVAPYFIKNEHNTSWIKKNYLLVNFVTIGLVGFLCLFIGVFAVPVVKILYGEPYLNVVNTMRILLIAAFCNCGLRYTTANIFAAMGEIRYNMLISFSGMILQIIFSLFTIPRYGMNGVAVTSCIVYTFMSICLLTMFIKRYYL